MIVLFDIGSTLIEGPPFGPTRRLIEKLGLDAAAAPVLDRLLFCSRSENPRELGEAVASELPVDPAAAIAACTGLWEAQLREAFVLPGAREAIAGLEQAGIARAYLSNIWPPFYERFQREFPREDSRRQYLSFQTGTMKPDRSFYHQALRELAVDPEDTVMVGDTYANDIRPAIELGMRTVWVLHRPEKERADLVRVLNGAAAAPDLTLASIADLSAARIEALFEKTHEHSEV